MVYKAFDKFASGGYGSAHQTRQAVADAGCIVIDITGEGMGTRASGKVSVSFVASLLEQAQGLVSAGKRVLLVHSGQDGLAGTSGALEAVAGQLDLMAVQMCISASELSSEGSNFGRDAAELLDKGALVAVHAVASGLGNILEVAAAVGANLLITASAGGKVSAEEEKIAATAARGMQVVAADDAMPDFVLRVAAGLDCGKLLTQPPVAPVDTKAEEARTAAIAARNASRQLQALPTAARQAVLERIAVALSEAEEEIIAANAKDVELSEKAGVEGALMQRLKLKPEKVKQLCAGVRAIAAQEEPIRKQLSALEVAEGLTLERVTAPIGVCLIIFEARPDALPQIASLAIRSGNGLLLKGGKEATHSNACLHRIITQALQPDVDPALISLVTSREGVDKLLALDDVIDLVIPRGSNSLVQYIQSHTRIPVLGHADGICHIYVDEYANINKAMSICVDSKIDYPAACNAVEKILVHHHLTTDGRLEKLLDALKAAGVTAHRGDVCSISAALDASMPPAPSNRHEYGTCDVTIEVVSDMEEAINHIHGFGSGHTECIITEDQKTAEHFLRSVDSACVNHNASTRFSDGFRFGLGAEVGISTSRIHARGPVGVEGLLTTRWLLKGNGQIVAKDKGVTYTHKKLPVQQSKH